jgi:hypothetical protein
VKSLHAPADSNLRANLARLVERSTPVRVTTSTTTFAVVHDLNAEPDDFHVSGLAAGSVWATEDNRKSWDERTLVLTASAAFDCYISAERW